MCKTFRVAIQNEEMATEWEETAVFNLLEDTNKQHLIAVIMGFTGQVFGPEQHISRGTLLHWALEICCIYNTCFLLAFVCRM